MYHILSRQKFASDFSPKLVCVFIYLFYLSNLLTFNTVKVYQLRKGKRKYYKMFLCVKIKKKKHVGCLLRLLAWSIVPYQLRCKYLDIFFRYSEGPGIFRNKNNIVVICRTLRAQYGFLICLDDLPKISAHFRHLSVVPSQQ